MDWYTLTYVLAVLAMLFSLFAQMKVQGNYRKYSAADNKKGITGAEAAKELMAAAGVLDVAIEKAQGTLSDHYDPQSGVLRLSNEVHDGKSLSAVGIAAHEAAHAIQHFEGYAPLNVRQNFTHIANIGSRMSIPIVMIGLFLLLYEAMFGLGVILVNAGLLLFTLVVIVSLITLPVEFNASSRAIAMLESSDMLTEEELVPVTRVLNAAAWTYIAATLSALITLLRLVILSRGRRR